MIPPTCRVPPCPFGQVPGPPQLAEKDDKPSPPPSKQVEGDKKEGEGGGSRAEEQNQLHYKTPQAVTCA